MLSLLLSLKLWQLTVVVLALSLAAGFSFSTGGGSLYVNWQGVQTFTGATVALGGAVPEPASWALMLGGFGLVGGAMRSRRRQAVSFA